MGPGRRDTSAKGFGPPLPGWPAGTPFRASGYRASGGPRRSSSSAPGAGYPATLRSACRTAAMRACATAELSPSVTKLSSDNSVARRVSPGCSLWPSMTPGCATMSSAVCRLIWRRLACSNSFGGGGTSLTGASSVSSARLKVRRVELAVLAAVRTGISAGSLLEGAGENQPAGRPGFRGQSADADSPGGADCQAT